MIEESAEFDKAMGPLAGIHREIGSLISGDDVSNPQTWVKICSLTEALVRAARDVRALMPEQSRSAYFPRFPDAG